MVELIAYDASEVNREGYKWNNYKWGDWPVEKGFRDTLAILNPPIPFLVRTIFGDYKEEDIPFRGSRKIIRPTFGNKNLRVIISRVLKNGHDCSEKNFRRGWSWKGHVPKQLLSTQVLWAEQYDDIKKAHPYRFDDDMGENPQGKINDFSIILDRKYYLTRDELRCPFYQSDIEKRRQALLAIIVSDTNPDRPKLSPLRFRLTPKNLNEVIMKLRSQGYFK